MNCPDFYKSAPQAAWSYGTQYNFETYFIAAMRRAVALEFRYSGNPAWDHLWKTGARWMIDDVPYVPTWPVMPDCYTAAARESARFMALERQQYREITGRRPLGSEEQGLLFAQDAAFSAVQFHADDIAENNGLLQRDIWQEYDVQPYNYRDLIAGFARVGERINAKRAAYEAALKAEVQAIQAGANPLAYSAEAQRIAEDLARQKKIDETLPMMPGNNAGTVGNNAAAVDYLVELGAGQQESGDFKDEMGLATWTGNLIDYWTQNGPRVECFREDNANLGGEVIFLRVTPKEKPKPHVSNFVKYGGLLSFAASFIPVIGNIVSLAIGEAQKQSMKALLSSVQKPGSIFEPQYVPRTMMVNLPGQLAAGLLAEPALLPLNVQRLAQSDYPVQVVVASLPASQAVSAEELREAQEAAHAKREAASHSTTGAGAGAALAWMGGGALMFGPWGLLAGAIGWALTGRKATV